MAEFTFNSEPVYDPVTDKVKENATGGKLVAYFNGPALPIYDLNDNPITSITSNPSGQSIMFKADVFQGLVQFGDIAVAVTAVEVAQFAVNAQGAIDTANNAATSSAAAAAAVGTALSRSFKIGRPGATTPTWWGAFTSSNKPTTAEGVQVGDLGILLP